MSHLSCVVTQRAKWSPPLVVAAVALLLTGQGISAQRLSYSSGQNVSPGYEGWEEDADGSRWFVFGYMNRNWEEEPNIPVGPENSIEPGGPDLGQPTHFLPRRNRFIFRVPVPDDFDEDDELVWTLTANGVTEQAFATLRPDYFMDSMVRASESGALGAGTSDPTIRANLEPTLTVEGESVRTVRVGDPITLVAMAEDDGVPESRRRRRFNRDRAREEAEQRRQNERESIGDRRWSPHYRGTVGSETGLRLSWFVYRGEGGVMFEPPQATVWEDTRTGANSPWAPHWLTPEPPEDGRFVAQVTFTEPGTYVLRCRASDGALDVDREITVTVTP